MCNNSNCYKSSVIKKIYDILAILLYTILLSVYFEIEVMIICTQNDLWPTSIYTLVVQIYSRQRTSNKQPSNNFAVLFLLQYKLTWPESWWRFLAGEWATSTGPNNSTSTGGQRIGVAPSTTSTITTSLWRYVLGMPRK